MFRGILAFGVLVAAFQFAWADEAVRRDGSRLKGNLVFTDRGRFEFRADNRHETIARIHAVRFAIKPRPLASSPIWHQVRLVNGDAFLAAIQRLDATHLHVRTAWADKLALPRPAIDRIEHVPGWRPLMVDTFDGDLTAWKVVGGARLEAGRLVFDRASQSAERILKVPIAAGKVVIGFHSNRTAGRRLAAELRFSRDGKPSPVRVELVGPDESYEVISPGRAAYQHRGKRTTGARRLTVEFDHDRLSIALDELVLWSQPVGAGELTAVQLVADGTGTESAAVDDIVVERPVSHRQPRNWADLTADAIRSTGGDETFGGLKEAGPFGVTIEVKGRRSTHPWPDLAECTFRRSAVKELTTTGEHVRARIRSAMGILDVVSGSVTKFDADALVLSHPLLGELSVQRRLLDELELSFYGRMVPIDTVPRHLGVRPAFGYAVPKPQGTRFATTVAVARATGGYVVVDAARIQEAGPSVEINVNGESVGFLNRQADRAEATVRSYRLPISTIGENVEIEIRVGAHTKNMHTNGVDLRAVRLELHDAR
jgi:hypothetical protein